MSLVRPTNRQHAVTLGAYWHTDSGTAGTDGSDGIKMDGGNQDGEGR